MTSIQTFKYPSRSSDVEHTVTVGANNRIHCTCRGFKSPSQCWHVRDVAEKLNIPHTARSNTRALQFDPPPALTATAPVTPIVTSTYFVEPMLGRALKEGEDLKDWVGRFNWSLEEKYDGHRVQVHVMPDHHIVVRSRDQNYRDLAPHIQNELTRIAPGVFDGELFIPGKSSTDVTRKDLFHRHRLVLFDLLAIYEQATLVPIIHLPLGARRQLLTMAMSAMTPLDVFQSPVYIVSTDRLNDIWTRGGEGVMLKKDDEPYFPGKRHWIKFKKELAARVTVTGFEKGLLGPYSRILAVDQHGIKVKCKTLNDKMRAAFTANPDTWIGRTLVISYQQKTPDGKYRHPRADHFEDDRSA